jgi:TPR repeat protein
MRLHHYLILSALLAAQAGAFAGVAEGIDAFTKQRYAEARKELSDAAEQGDANAMAIMGEMLMRGQGGARDELKARTFITQAQEAGSIRATYALGQMNLNGNLVAKDEAKGIALIKQAAEQRFPQAQVDMGAWLYGGLRGFEKNEPVALTWFQEAAAQDNPAAMGWMGFYYEQGKGGVTADPLVALDWYKKAGERANASAMVSAGVMYALGKGVSADGAEALRWFKRGVAAGNSTAYIWMASVYEFGRGGIVKAPNLAYAWYLALPANAIGLNQKTAADGKERLAKLMGNAEVEEATKLSKSIAAQTIAAETMAKLVDGAIKPAIRRGVYGSGVAVSRQGDILTNEHVVQGCEKVRIQPAGVDVTVVAKDSRNDLALLRVKGVIVPAIKFRAGRGLRMGDELVVVGYPLRGILSSGAVVTTGIVNALTGVSDDTSSFQMSATVQPGSSGGPIFDNTGMLVGLVRARLLPSGPIAAQNVNFGINQATLTNFLDAHSIEFVTNTGSPKSMNLVDLTAMAQKSTVQVECY